MKYGLLMKVWMKIWTPYVKCIVIRTGKPYALA